VVPPSWPRSTLQATFTKTGNGGGRPRLVSPNEDFARELPGDLQQAGFAGLSPFTDSLVKL